MNLRRSVIEHFVMPSGHPQPAAHEDFAIPGEGPDRACADPAPRTPAAVGVLCAAADAEPLGAALGLALAGRRRAPVVAVCVWTGELTSGAAWGAPALGGARRLAATLAARGHEVRAAGRLVVVRLPAAATDAAEQARRAIAAAGTAPTVLSLGGPRVAAFDALLIEQDLVVVAAASGADPALARLAVAGLSSAVGQAYLCEMPPAHPARSLAVAGVALLPSVRRALAAPVEALS